MKIEKIILMAALLIVSLISVHAQFNIGDLAVLQVGNGSTALSSSGDPISLLDVTTAGVIESTINIPSGSGGLQISGTATSEGQLVANADGQSFTIAGYVPPFSGSGSLGGRSSANAPRGYATVNFNGIVSSTTTLPSGTYSSQNIRSGFVSGTGSWFSGSGTGSGNGLEYYNGSSATKITATDTRVLNYYGGSLYYSTPTGIFKFSGLPTAAVTAATVLTGVSGEGANASGFVFSPDGNTLYVADSADGVQKFTFNGSAWTLAYNFTDSSTANEAYGLAVNFSGANPVVYWTSPTAVWEATDTGSSGSGTSILSVGTDYAFDGLEIVPEPSTLALGGLGLMGLFGFRRLKNHQS
jgi:PEP-CTERM motif